MHVLGCWAILPIRSAPRKTDGSFCLQRLFFLEPFQQKKMRLMSARPPRKGMDVRASRGIERCFPVLLPAESVALFAAHVRGQVFCRSLTYCREACVTVCVCVCVYVLAKMC